jgi:hypothetical protein
VQIRPGNGAVALTAGLAVAVLLGPLLLRGDTAENARLDANRRKIAEMTEANRQKLLRNFERWQSLSSADQRQWREFSQQLETQRATLGPVVEDYYGWLQTIPGYRRDELRKASDVQQKVSVVKEIVQEALAERLDVPEETSIDFGGRELQVLTSAELDAVITALEEGLTTAEQGSVAALDGSELVGLERHLMVIKQLLRHGGIRQALDSPANRKRVYEALPERVQELLTSLPERTGAPLGVILSASLWLELDRAFRASTPTPADLLAFYESIESADEREQLLSLSAHDLHSELQRRYFLSQLEERLEIDIERIQQFMAPPRGDGPRGGMRMRPALGGGILPRGEQSPGPGNRPPDGFRGPPDGGERPRRPFDGAGPFNGDRPLREGEARPPEPAAR